MTRREHVLIVGAAIAHSLFAACHLGPPDSVPKGATHVPWGASGIWAHCAVSSSTHLVNCRIYNASGVQLRRPNLRDSTDDVYLRFQGNTPLVDEDLEIDPLRTGPVVIWLKNGVILLPRGQYDWQKQALEETLEALAKRDRR